MNNLVIYEFARGVPAEAKRPINAGRLKGMTDINPMYRIKRLTELFGPCGVGWWYEITDKHLTADEITKQVAAFVDILLYYKDPETGEPSKGIPGTGGSSFVSQERNGPYMSDECYKMALTDAIGVAAKALGIGADVYWEKDRTKYSGNPDEGNSGSRKQKGNQDCSSGDFTPKCADCGEVIDPKVHDYSVDNFGRPLCRKCQRAATGETDEAPKEDERPGKVWCERCDKEIVPYISPKNGGGITPQMHAAGSLTKYKAVLCLKCIEKENARLAGEAR